VLDTDPVAAAKDKDVQALLLALLAKIAAAPCDATGDPNTDCKIKQLRSFATGAVVPLQGSKISDQQIKDMHAALDPVLSIVPAGDDVGLTSAIGAATKIANTTAVVAPEAVVSSLDALVLALQTKITAATSAAPATRTAAAITAMNSVSANVGLILKALGANDSLIRVTGAWYGDLGAIRRKLSYGGLGPFHSTSRYCSATRAVRTRCQGQPHCYEPADAPAKDAASTAGGSTTEIDGFHMCGYEPAPFAEPREKGLIVRYECISAHDQVWSEAAVGDDASAEQGDNDAQIRNGAIGAIRCQPVAVAHP
jgi:hypothetical protein